MESASRQALRAGGSHDHLTRALETLNAIPWFGLQEHFGRSLDLLTDMLGWEPFTLDTRLNVGPPQEERMWPTDAERTEMLARMALDIELYQAAGALFEQRYTALVKRLLWADRQRRTPPAALSEAHVTFDHHFRGEGWYPHDVDAAGRPLRWLGPGPRGLVYVLIKPAPRLQLRVTLFHVIVPEYVRQLEVRVNGQRVPLRAAWDARARQTTLTGVFAGAWVDQPITTVEFAVPRTLRPAEVDPANADPRRLGVAVYALDITPTRDPLTTIDDLTDARAANRG